MLAFRSFHAHSLGPSCICLGIYRNRSSYLFWFNLSSLSIDRTILSTFRLIFSAIATCDAFKFDNLAAHGIQKIRNLYNIRSINTAINATWTDGHTASVVAAPTANPIQNDRHREQSNGLMLAHSSMFSHCLM